MFSPVLSERVDALIDDLIMDGGVEAASLASILLAANDAVKRDHHVRLSRLVWTANNDLTEPEEAETEYEVEPAVSTRP